MLRIDIKIIIILYVSLRIITYCIWIGDELELPRKKTKINHFVNVI